MKILVVEDEPHLAQIVQRVLKEVGFKVYVESDGKMALTQIKQKKFDLVMLDIMLPSLNGDEILFKMREKGIDTPVIMLTAIGTQESIVSNLNLGSDDYIVKPFKVDELIARVNSVLRRGNLQKKLTPKQEEIFQIQNIQLNNTSKRVLVHGEDAQLTSKEFDLLRFFLLNKNKVLSREQILENVWGIDFQIGTNVVDVYVNYLRKKIKSSKENPIIETVIGMGYIIKSNE